MSFIAKRSRLLVLGLSCAVLGAAASAITGAGAATRSPATTSPAHPAKASTRPGRRSGGLRRWTARAVHGDLVVKIKSGFVTVSFDRGKVDSVAGRRLTITEGTRRANYRTVTVAVPASAAVRDNRKPARLSDLRSGQRVVVVQTPTRTLVVARTPKAG
ncbi:MAG TPA: hypothetical protein VGH45_01195 [Solirubrobacteraceae bacterium]|jgi:hypothetical protein